jgi:hypothetical protein
MLLERVARAARSRGASLLLLLLAVRLQRVDGRRLDAFVADLHCSRVHRGAAPIVSYVSALLVRVQVCESALCASLAVARVGVLVGVRVLVRVCVHASWGLAQRVRGGKAQRGYCELRVLVLCSRARWRDRGH